MSRKLRLKSLFPVSGRQALDGLTWPARPKGELLWCHGGTQADLDSLHLMAARMIATRPALFVLITVETTDLNPPPAHDQIMIIHAPDDSQKAAVTFLDHWAPDACLWVSRKLIPALISAGHGRGLNMLLAQASEAVLKRSKRWRVLNAAPKSLLACFSKILATDEDAAQSLHKLVPDRVEQEIFGHLERGSVTLTYDDTQLQDLAEQLRSRPIWLAAGVTKDEMPIVLDAHRQLSRFAHRAILILVPDGTQTKPQLQSILKSDNWRTVSYDADEPLGETAQIVLADDSDLLGLWYRLSPICFVGGTFSGDHCDSPYIPAAHGSCIIYGASPPQYKNSFQEFASADAALQIKDGDDLAAALKELIGPDKSAQMTHAAWELVTKSAYISDYISDLAEDMLDLGGAHEST